MNIDLGSILAASSPEDFFSWWNLEEEFGVQGDCYLLSPCFVLCFYNSEIVTV